MSCKSISRCRRWTKQNLTEDDYRFAISSSREKWECLATRLWTSKIGMAHWIAEELFIWEIWREVFVAPPFLSVQANQQRIQNAFSQHKDKPADLPPLEEIPVEKAARYVKARRQFANKRGHPGRLVYQGMSIHAFLLYRDEPTESVVQRFRNWLVRFRTQSDPREWMGLVRKVDIRFREGRQSFDVFLRALAVRRLKEAAYSRAEAEQRLNLKRYSLDGQWNKLPKIAERLTSELEAVPLVFGRHPPFQFK